MNIRIVITSLIALFFVIAWWGMYETGPLKFRGANIVSSGKEDIQSAERLNSQTYTLERYKYLSSFCSELPLCIRVLPTSIVLGVYYAITKPLFHLTNKNLKRTYLPLDLSSTFVTLVAYLTAFIFIGYLFSFPTSLFAMIVFGITPMKLWIVGVTYYDPISLVTWIIFISLMTNIMSRELRKTDLIKIGLISGFSTLVIDNIGLCQSASLFFLLVASFFFKIERKNIFKLFVSSFLGTLIFYGVALLIAYRNSDVHYLSPGKSLKDAYEVLGKFNNYSSFFHAFLNSLKYPFIYGIGYFLINYLVVKLRVKKGMFELKFDYVSNNRVLLYLSCFLGFCVSLIPALFLSGIQSEWPRQFLPLFMLSIILFFSIAERLLFMGTNEKSN